MMRNEILMENKHISIECGSVVHEAYIFCIGYDIRTLKLGQKKGGGKHPEDLRSQRSDLCMTEVKWKEQ